MKAECIDGKVYVKLDTDLVDEMAVALLKEGKTIAEESLKSTARLMSEHGWSATRQQDFSDDARYLQAFNTLLEYYGVYND